MSIQTISREIPLRDRLYGDFQSGLKFQLVKPSWNFISAERLIIWKILSWDEITITQPSSNFFSPCHCFQYKKQITITCKKPGWNSIPASWTRLETLIPRWNIIFLHIIVTLVSSWDENKKFHLFSTSWSFFKMFILGWKFPYNRQNFNSANQVETLSWDEKSPYNQLLNSELLFKMT